MSLFHPIKDPVEGTMHVVSCSTPDARAMRAPCRINYVVQAPGIEAFSGEYTFEMWSAEWAEPGEDIPVIFDREHHDRIKIDDDKRRAAMVSPEDQAAQLAAQINAGGGSTLPGVTPIVVGNADPAQMAQAEQMLGVDLDGDGVVGSAAKAAEDDTVSRLERLGKLRDQGVLTPEEFEAQKAKILGGG
jgi:hypothetical protein